MAKSNLLQYAKDWGYITPEQFKKLQDYKEEAVVNDETAFADTKILSEDKILEINGRLYGYPIEFEPELQDTGLAKSLKYQELIGYGFLPERIDDLIRIITSKPAELLYAEDIITEQTGYKGSFQYLLVTDTTLKNLLSFVFEKESSGMTADEYGFGDSESVERTVYNVSENDTSAVVNIVNKIFREAVERKVSDVHFQPQEDGFYIRFREDGALKKEYVLPVNVSRQIINRIKTMSNMDVNNSRIIQDGNARLEIYGKTVDLRVSIIPAVNGENLVIRILDQNKMSFDISMLGFSEENEERFKKLIHRPQGIILLTGPTGSGKSTSLYAALSVLNTPDKCIITFEDPPEYRIPGIVQVQINPAMDVTFPQALKSGLRQDIEVALVGEIRDRETASIAFDAANTGHMVFSTLHTNSAASSILRLVKMGIEPFVVSRTLVAVINQRLAKRICPYCMEEYYL